MRDVHAGHAFSLEVANDPQQDLDLRAGQGPECVKTRQNVVGAQRLLSVVGYLAPKSFWLSYGGPD
ncbi:hypothetical protein JN853_14665 [Pseudomonas syringae pv. actinidiae ICMP 9853]|nr:hypothetical protein JN853_14665 [Pseudomonas syringae pv. actinidiae ICMP 9853]